MRLARLAIFFLVLTSMMTTTSALAGQQPSDPPPAPVPAPIFTAKKVFVSNATGEIVLPPGNPDLTYNEFYAAMKSWGRYELVSSPADADLVFEIRFTFVIGPTGVRQGDGGSTQDFQFRLVILDAKSHVVLWAFSESIPRTGIQAKRPDNFEQTLAIIVGDVKNLAGRSPAAGR